jgi:hypothetical protein
MNCAVSGAGWVDETVTVDFREIQSERPHVNRHFWTIDNGELYCWGSLNDLSYTPFKNEVVFGIIVDPTSVNLQSLPKC